jgi:hypothetical protein
MEKLIELIVEFQKEIWQTTYDLDMYHYDDKLKLIIIWSDVSKWYIDYIDIFRLLFAPWFIKWLVDNDKIDFEKKLNTIRFESLVDQTLDSYLALLMLLSIQDNPIEFLISILK